jgi:hypothetical protein
MERGDLSKLSAERQQQLAPPEEAFFERHGAATGDAAWVPHPQHATDAGGGQRIPYPVTGPSGASPPLGQARLERARMTAAEPPVPSLSGSSGGGGAPLYAAPPPPMAATAAAPLATSTATRDAEGADYLTGSTAAGTAAGMRAVSSAGAGGACA